MTSPSAGAVWLSWGHQGSPALDPGLPFELRGGPSPATLKSRVEAPDGCGWGHWAAFPWGHQQPARRGARGAGGRSQSGAHTPARPPASLQALLPPSSAEPPCVGLDSAPCPLQAGASRTAQPPSSAAGRGALARELAPTLHPCSFLSAETCQSAHCFCFSSSLPCPCPAHPPRRVLHLWGGYDGPA